MKTTIKEKLHRALFYTVFNVGIFLYILTVSVGIDACIKSDIIELLETLVLFVIGTIFMLISLFLTKWS